MGQDESGDDRRSLYGNASLSKVYLDTSVLGHWMLYYFRNQRNKKRPTTKNVQSSMQLIRQIEKGFYACEFETSDFALRELLQVIRDSILAGKMLKDAQPLSYFHQLKDYYAFEGDEWGDAYTYMHELRLLLVELNVTLSRVYLFSKSIMQSLEELCYSQGIELNDATHIAWAHHRKCRYLVTTDRRLLDRVGNDSTVGGVRVINPATLSAKPDVRKHPKQLTKSEN